MNQSQQTKKSNELKQNSKFKIQERQNGIMVLSKKKKKKNHGLVHKNGNDLHGLVDEMAIFPDLPILTNDHISSTQFHHRSSKFRSPNSTIFSIIQNQLRS